MSDIYSLPVRTFNTPCGHLPQMTAVPASAYDYDRLAKIYSDARVDYIVPMPMNGKRMREYVTNYDVDLDASVVAECHDRPAGIGMLGMRGDRGWITRLGVMPDCRRCRFAHLIVQTLLDHTRSQGVNRVQLEVIVGNDGAYTLFENFGFQFTRQLLVIRRPPVKLIENPDFEAAQVEIIPTEEIPQILAKREPGASWVEETASLLNANNLAGLRLHLPSCEQEGWVVFQRSPFQLQHFVLAGNICDDVGAALLYHVHKTHPHQDTKIENIPAGHHSWRIYQQLGYVEAFRRNEMVLDLA